MSGSLRDDLYFFVSVILHQYILYLVNCLIFKELLNWNNILSYQLTDRQMSGSANVRIGKCLDRQMSANANAWISGSANVRIGKYPDRQMSGWQMSGQQISIRRN